MTLVYLVWQGTRKFKYVKHMSICHYILCILVVTKWNNIIETYHIHSCSTYNEVDHMFHILVQHPMKKKILKITISICFAYQKMLKFGWTTNVPPMLNFGVHVLELLLFVPYYHKCVLDFIICMKLKWVFKHHLV